MKNKVLKTVADAKEFLKKTDLQESENTDNSCFERDNHIASSKEASYDSNQQGGNLFNDNDYKKVWSKALNILNRRDHSVNELKGKLFDRELPAKQIYEVIEELQRLGFLNDENFAEMYTEDLLRRGYGAMRIKNYLYKKRLSSDLIDKMIVKIDFSEQIQTAVKLIENKLRGGFRREKDPYKLQQKLTRHLIGRGFTFDVINCAFDETIKKGN